MFIGCSVTSVYSSFALVAYGIFLWKAISCFAQLRSTSKF